MNMRYIGVFLFVFFLCEGVVSGQRLAVSTNIMGYAALGTLNAGLSYSVSQHWSVQAGLEYNPWTFRKNAPGKQFQSRKKGLSAGMRYWYWHSNSGWWTEGKLKYQEYNAGGLIRRRTEEGDRFGFVMAAGYTYMLHPRINLEFGFGVCGGIKKYTVYSCPSCGVIERYGKKAFFIPDDLIATVSYVF